jgi:SAM-dependent methyltransferase
MHLSSLNRCEEFVDQYVCEYDKKIADVGSMNINGCYKPLFEGREYVGFDTGKGRNVDVVLNSSEDWRLPDEHRESYDIVISGQVLEHVKRPWLWIHDVVSLCKPGGLIWICAPNTWAFHEYPIDCWRVWPDGMKALFEDAGLEGINCFVNGKDTVGIGKKTNA